MVLYMDIWVEMGSQKGKTRVYQIQGSYPQPYGSGLEAATNDKEMGSTGYMLMSFYI